MKTGTSSSSWASNEGDDVNQTHADYARRTGEIEHYFDRTPLRPGRADRRPAVSGIRATVRKGREDMRATLSSWLPTDLSGWRVLDAGCGSGVLTMELMARGADVVGIDLSAGWSPMPANAPKSCTPMSSVPSVAVSVSKAATCWMPRSGRFDAVVAMDVLIHYNAADAARGARATGRPDQPQPHFHPCPGSRC